jgi:ribosome-associated heat shock protein Hsp15
MSEALALPGLRVDKWLWAARVFKTRSLAAKACEAGHVKLAGENVKPAKNVRVGETLEIVLPGGLKILEVKGLSETRGPAPVARTLYEDHSPPPPPREYVEPFPRRDRGMGRPTKRDRRDMNKLRGG